jgi:hypothetical protein
MLIFHKFSSLEQAAAFARSVTQREKLPASFHATQDESNAVDPFPFELLPPIVLVGRGDLGIEEALRVRVQDFGGEFAGT